MKRGLFLVLVFHLALFWWKFSQDPGWWQQDNYWGYSRAIIESVSTGRFEFHENWLFPGLAWLLVVFSPWFIATLSLATIYILSWLITKNWFFSVLVTVFPPIIFEQTSKLSTESAVMALWLAAYYFLSQKKNISAGLALGLATVIRPIGATLWLASAKKLGKGNLAALMPVLILIGFNVFWLKSVPWHQAVAYRELTPVDWPIFQLPEDIMRAIDWGYWRILVSGAVYLLLVVAGLTLTLKNGSKLIKLWLGLSLLYIMSIGPVPLLEEIRRFLAVIFPLILVTNYRVLNRTVFILPAALFSLLAFW